MTKNAIADPVIGRGARGPWKHKAERAQMRLDKREAVLLTAAEVFIERGFHGATLDEVADRLHITKPTLYYYIKNKEEIVFECSRIGMTQIRDMALNVAAQDGSVVDRLVAFMRRYAELITTEFGMCSIRVGIDPLNDEHRQIVLGLRNEIDGALRTLIAAGVADGSLVDCDPKLASTTLLGSLSSIAYWYRPDGPLSRRQIAERCIALIAFGLCGRKPEATSDSPANP
jgi:AcrR family transcriptional regulator